MLLQSQTISLVLSPLTARKPLYFSVFIHLELPNLLGECGSNNDQFPGNVWLIKVSNLTKVQLLVRKVCEAGGSSHRDRGNLPYYNQKNNSQVMARVSQTVARVRDLTRNFGHNTGDFPQTSYFKEFDTVHSLSALKFKVPLDET